MTSPGVPISLKATSDKANMWTTQTGKKQQVFGWCPMASEGAYAVHYCTHPDKHNTGRKFRCDCNKIDRASQPPPGCPLMADPLVKTITWDPDVKCLCTLKSIGLDSM